MSATAKTAKSFSLSACVDRAPRLAEYEKDENGVIVASAPNVSGFFSRGENLEAARVDLRGAMEGNLPVALRFGFGIPPVAGVEIKEIDYAQTGAAQSR